ncbi:MAG: hypothetical protein M0P49_01525 [Bacilli bacterium]|nr:hypothetical protein [Bacilli bacterium]
MIKVGDKVKSKFNGLKGIVMEIKDGGMYPIIVELENGSINPYCEDQLIIINGRPTKMFSIKKGD